MQEKHASALEILLVATLFPVQSIWYNLIGNLAALEKVNYQRFVELPGHFHYPIFPILSFFYMFDWIYPVILYIYAVIKLWPDYLKFRRIYIGFLVLLLVNFTIWLIIPNQDTHRIPTEILLTYGWIGKATLFVYQAASIWNSFPSFHVGATWFCFRLLQIYIKKLHWVAFLVVILTMITVLAIRVHQILDLVGGVLIAELVIQTVLKPLEKRNAFSKGSHLFWCSLYVGIFVVAMGLRFILVDWLAV